MAVGAFGQQVQLSIPCGPHALAHGVLDGPLLPGGQSFQGMGLGS